MKTCIKLLVFYFLLISGISNAKTLYLKVDGEINQTSFLYLKFGFKNSQQSDIESIILELNTFGGSLSSADNIRQLLLDSKKPIYCLVNKNAASAGALIALASDSIYMIQGSSIGAATVVNGYSGEVMSEKYQSYMRSLMRNTAEARNRNPKIAESFVESLDSNNKTSVVSLTANEAFEAKICDKVFNNYEDFQANFQKNKNVETFELSFFEKIYIFLNQSWVSTILIIVIIVCTWLEIQSPGLGLPIVVAVIAGFLYVFSHYLSGLLEFWEIGIFIVGIILLMLEIFVIPGFGIVGIAGIALVLGGILLAMLPNKGFNFELISSKEFYEISLYFFLILVLTIVLVIFITKMILKSKKFKKISLSDQSIEPIKSDFEHLLGAVGVAYTDLKTSGKIKIENQLFDAISSEGFIQMNEEIVVEKIAMGQLVVKRK